MSKKILLLIVLTVIGCNKTKESSKDNSLQNVLEKGIFGYGNCPEYPPFSFINDKGNIQGYDVDFASYIASNIGVKSEVNNIPWESLIVALNQKQYDAVISAITPLEAQSAGELVDFTIPYITLNEIIITKKSLFVKLLFFIVLSLS